MIDEARARRTVLLVEDNPEDHFAFRRVVEKAGINAHLAHSRTSDGALQYLLNTSGADRPSLVVLDLNLPGDDGRSVLVKIKKRRELSAIPVVILSSSIDPKDVMNCYLAGAASYVQKPVNLARFEESVKNLLGYWLDSAVLPDTEYMPAGSVDG